MKTKNQYRLLEGVPLDKLADYIEKSEHSGFELFQVIMGMVPVNNAGGIVKPGERGVQMIAMAYPLMVRTISAEPPGKDG